MFRNPAVALAAIAFTLCIDASRVDLDLDINYSHRYDRFVSLDDPVVSHDLIDAVDRVSRWLGSEKNCPSYPSAMSDRRGFFRLTLQPLWFLSLLPIRGMPRDSGLTTNGRRGSNDSRRARRVVATYRRIIANR
jgi:hypothetical protein